MGRYAKSQKEEWNNHHSMPCFSATKTWIVEKIFRIFKFAQTLLAHSKDVLQKYIDNNKKLWPRNLSSCFVKFKWNQKINFSSNGNLLNGLFCEIQMKSRRHLSRIADLFNGLFWEIQIKSGRRLSRNTDLSDLLFCENLNEIKKAWIKNCGFV